jgi:2-polyprenyl-3-methyl-5-hydroxy-6-metoxy-1,4-benzoquinol methylase
MTKQFADNSFVPVPRCPVCGSGDRRIAHRIMPADLFYGYVYTVTHLGRRPPEYFTIYECNKCQHWYVNPRLSDEELLACYPPERFTHGVGYFPFSTLRKGAVQQATVRNSGSLWNEIWAGRASKLEQFDIPERSILDFGCADGAFLRAVPEHWKRCGIDNNDGAIDLAKQSSPMSIEFISDDLTTHEWGTTKFGVISAYDVLEHVTDPNTIMASLSRLLLPGGILWAEIPCMESPGAKAYGKQWALITPAVHLHYYSYRSIELLLNRHGLRLERHQMGERNKLLMRQIAWKFKRRRMFVSAMTKYGFGSRMLNALLATAGVVDDRETFLRKLSNINAAEALRPRYHDEIIIVGRRMA